MKALTFLQSVLPRPADLVSALRRIVPRKVLDKALLENIDRRILLESVAETLNLTTSELLGRAAEQIGIPAVTSIPSDPFPETFDSKSLDLWYRMGCSPIVRNDEVTGFACVDPRPVKQLIQKNGDIFLACWNAIKHTLDFNSGSQGLKPHNEQASINILEGIRNEVLRFDGDCAVIAKRDPSKYSIPLGARRSAEGRVGVPFIRTLERTLSENRLIHLAHGFAEVHSDDSDFHVFFKSGESGSRTAVRKITGPSKDRSNREPAVLLVDDNETFAQVLRRHLAKHGIRMTHAGNGAEALEVLRSGQDLPSLIISDIHMPVMNGFEFVKRVQGISELKNTPVIVLTSDSDVEAEIAFLEAGVSAFIGKQDDPRILSLHVCRNMGLKHGKVGE